MGWADRGVFVWFVCIDQEDCSGILAGWPDIRNGFLVASCDRFPVVSRVAVRKYVDRRALVVPSVIDRSWPRHGSAVGILFNGGKAYSSFDSGVVAIHWADDSIPDRYVCVSRTV